MQNHLEKKDNDKTNDSGQQRELQLARIQARINAPKHSRITNFRIHFSLLEGGTPFNP